MSSPSIELNAFGTARIELTQDTHAAEAEVLPAIMGMWEECKRLLSEQATHIAALKQEIVVLRQENEAAQKANAAALEVLEANINQKIGQEVQQRMQMMKELETKLATLRNQCNAFNLGFIKDFVDTSAHITKTGSVDFTPLRIHVPIDPDCKGSK
jgi:hypothetical protein